MASSEAGNLTRLESLGAALRRSMLIWDQPISAAILAGAIYLMFALTVGTPWRISTYPYYNYLADAFLHGQLNLRLIPPLTRDLSFFSGNYYLYWGPLPAILIMPLVALFGVGVSDILQSLIIGAVNAGLFALFLRKACKIRLFDLSRFQRALLVLLFVLGSPHTPLPAVGRVWEISSLLTVTFALLAFLAAFSFDGRKAFFWTGMGVVGVMMTRISGVFIAVFLAWYLLRKYWAMGWKPLLRLCLAGAIPVMVGILLLAAYNWLRFGSPLNNGLNYQLSDPNFIDNARQYGFFNLHYVWPNLYYQFLVYPFSINQGNFAVEGWGGSLFLLSPLFFAAPLALWHDRRNPVTWVLLITILLLSIPLLVNIAPGTLQFGPRYTLDFIVPLFLLTALGMRLLPNWLVSVLVTIAILHYLVGALMFVHIVA